MKNLNGIIKFLSSLGLSFDQSKLYIALLDEPGVTILQISRSTKISRTNVYRLIDELKDLGLVEELKRDGKKLIIPVGVHRLEMIVKEHEAKVELMRSLLPELSTLISSSEAINQGQTQVQLYKGIDGVRQMLWNSLKANKECLGYTFKNINELVGEKFANDWREEFQFKKLKFRDLVSDSFMASLISEQKEGNGNLSFFTSRYLAKTVLDISHQINIYNNVVSYYLWNENEIFGIEIHNQKIADLQKQLFELAWEKGVEV